MARSATLRLDSMPLARAGPKASLKPASPRLGSLEFDDDVVATVGVVDDVVVDDDDVGGGDDG